MLKKQRIKKGLTQSQLAKGIGIKNKGYISKLETNPYLCNPSVNIILKLSKELDISPIEVFIYFIENKKI